MAYIICKFYSVWIFSAYLNKNGTKSQKSEIHNFHKFIVSFAKSVIDDSYKNAFHTYKVLGSDRTIVRE